MYVLYGGDFTRAALVQWVLDEGDISYELRKVDILKGEHRSAGFLAINPAGLVPVLITHNGEEMYEVAAMMLYLTERHRLTVLAPAPDDPSRGAFLSSFFHVASDIQPEIKRFHYPHRFSLRPEDNLRTQELAKSLVLNRLGIINKRLGQRGPYLLGDRFSMADFYLSFWIAYLDRRTVSNLYPAVAKLYQLTRDRPRATRYLAETEAMADNYAQMMLRNPNGVIA